MGAGREAAEGKEGEAQVTKQQWLARVLRQRPDWDNARDLKSLGVVWRRRKRK